MEDSAVHRELGGLAAQVVSLSDRVKIIDQHVLEIRDELASKKPETGEIVAFGTRWGKTERMVIGVLIALLLALVGYTGKQMLTKLDDLNRHAQIGTRFSAEDYITLEVLCPSDPDPIACRRKAVAAILERMETTGEP